MTAAGPQIRHLQRDLAEAGDGKIIRVLAMVDAIAERGPADSLIAPLRGRLAQLRPQRPLRFVRLLFAPFDPLVIPATKWRRGTAALPRTALAPLGALVLAHLPDRAALQTRLAGATTDQTDRIAAGESALWPEAATILAHAPPPADWTDATGLQADDYRLLARSLAALFAQAPALLRLLAAARAGTPPTAVELEAMLSATIPGGADALAMMTATLMAQLPRPETLVAVADDLAARQSDPAFRVAADRAVDFLLDDIEAAPPDPPDLAQAADALARTVILLGDLDARPGQRPGRRGRIDGIRRKIDATARARFAADLDSQLLGPAASLATADIEALERSSRDLRRYETQARQLGGADQYDRALQQAATRLHPRPGDTGDAVIDRVRLVEILQGPEAALALLSAR